MRYEYGNIKDMKVGDVLEYNNPEYEGSFTHGRFYISNRYYNPYHGTIDVALDDRGSEHNGHNKKFWKLVKTKPGSEVKPGDSIVCINLPVTSVEDSVGLGEIKIAQPGVVNSDLMYWSSKCSHNNLKSNWRVIYTESYEFNPRILGEPIIVNCKTEDEAILFLTWAYDNGKEWVGGDSYKRENNWREYKEDTCYIINKGMYANVPWHIDMNENIWTYEDALL